MEFYTASMQKKVFIAKTTDSRFLSVIRDRAEDLESVDPELYEKRVVCPPGMLESTLRIILQAESCLFKLGMPRFWWWPENPGDMACAGAFHDVFIP